MLDQPQTRQAELFGCLSGGDLAYLEQRKISRQYRAGEWVVHYREVWPFLFAVDRGEITALKESSEGRSLILTSIKPGEVFWGLAFFNEDVPMWVGLCAHEDSEISLWRREDVLPLLLKNGEFTWGLACMLVHRMERASDIVEELAFQPVTGRLANLLLDHYGDNPEGFVARDLTLDEMAAYIGTTREMVCRQLYRLANQGLIQINRTEYKIVNFEGLQRLKEIAKG